MTVVSNAGGADETPDFSAEATELKGARGGDQELDFDLTGGSEEEPVFEERASIEASEVQPAQFNDFDSEEETIFPEGR